MGHNSIKSPRQELEVGPRSGPYLLVILKDGILKFITFNITSKQGVYFAVHFLGSIRTKGLQRQCLIGSAVAGFNHARTITKASAPGLDGRQDEYNKEICSPGSLFNYSVR